MQGGSKRETGPKGRCDQSPPRRQRGLPKGGLIEDLHKAAPAVVDGARPHRRQ
jgi:hypothetical protein